jgi:hypothetical protein
MQVNTKLHVLISRKTVLGAYRSAWRYNTNRMCWNVFWMMCWFGQMFESDIASQNFDPEDGGGGCLFETSLNFYQTARRNMPEDTTVQVRPGSYVWLTWTLFREIILTRIYTYCMSIRNVLPGCTASQLGGKHSVLVFSFVNLIARGCFDPNVETCAASPMLRESELFIPFRFL